MKEYLEKRNQTVIKITNKMRELRDLEIKTEGRMLISSRG